MQVPCHFVPQLQMEMLASGASSALVVSRSATKVCVGSRLPVCAMTCAVLCHDMRCDVLCMLSVACHSWAALHGTETGSG